MKPAVFSPEAAAVVVRMLAEAEAKMARLAQVFGGSFSDPEMAQQFAAVKSAQFAMGAAS